MPPPFPPPFRHHPQQRPLGLCLLPVSFPTLSPSPFPAPPPSLPSPLSSSLPPHPSFTLRYVLSQHPPGSSAPALSRCPSNFSASALSGLQRPPLFRPRSAKQDRTEGFRSVLFGRTVLKGRGVLGADTKKPKRGAGKEQVPGSKRRVLKKRKEIGGRGAVLGRREEKRAASEGGRRWEWGYGEKKGE